MKARFARLSIGQKVLAALLLSSGAGFAVFIAVFVPVWVGHEQSEHAAQIGTVADVIARNSPAAVAFEDPNASREMLQGLEGMLAVIGGRIYTENGKVLAEHRTTGRDLPGAFSGPELGVVADERSETRFQFGGLLRLLRPIVLDRQEIGWVELVADTGDFWIAVAEDMIVPIGLALVGFSLSIAFGLYFRRILSRPIEQLAAAADRIADEESYAMEISYAGHDELGTLIGSFRRMLSRIEERTRQLLEAKELAVGANQAKSEFLSVVSQQIRAPLSALIGASEMLQESERSERDREMAAVAYRSAQALLRVVDELLEFSRVDAGKIELVSAAFDVGALVAGACEEISRLARDKGLRLECAVASEARGRYRGDSARLHQVLAALLDNAVRYTECGGVEVRVAIVDGRDDQARLHFEVRDSGPGIESDAIGALFDPFRESGASCRRGQGAGLGLAISRRLVSLMGGSLGVESEPGAGTTFWFNVPLEREPAAPASSIDDRTGQDLAGLRKSLQARNPAVLLGEHDPAAASVLCAMLEHAGVHVALVRDGHLALEALRAERFDAALLELHLPGKDGVAVMQNLREFERLGPDGSNCIAVALTTQTTHAERERCLNSGFDALLIEPVTQQQLLGVLVRLLAQTAVSRNYPGS